MDKNILEEVKGLYRIVLMDRLREMEGVTFEYLPPSVIPKISSLDRVIHQASAISPAPVSNVERPWYMHLHQDDNLMVLHGKRIVDIYTPDHGKIEQFVITPESVHHGKRLVHDGPAMLVWPRGVFHRIESGEEGSASLNLATHYDGLDLKTNFNVYDLDPETGKHRLLRKGELDQF